MAVKVNAEGLRAHRESLGLSMADVSETSGIKYDRIQALETGNIGKTKESLKYAEALCDYYEIERSEFINYDYRETKIVTFGMAKGGTGKTTSVGEISYHLGQKYKVLIIDADPQCNLTRLFSPKNIKLDSEYDGKNFVDYIEYPELEMDNLKVEDFIKDTRFKNIKIIKATPSLNRTERKLRVRSSPFGPFLILREQLLKLGKFDFVLIDTKPGQDTTTLGLYMIADKFYIPMDLSALTIDSFPSFNESLIETKQLKKQFLQLNFEITGVIKTRTKMRRLVDQEVSNFIDKNFGNLVFETGIPDVQSLGNAQYEGYLHGETKGKSRGQIQVNKAYEKLASEVAK